MLTASWGKRATSRIDRTQFDKDELLQSLGDQFNVDFADYDKWKRKASIRRPLPGKEDKAKPSFPGRGISSADSCKHGLSHLTYRERKEAEKKIEEDKTRSERLKILDLRLKTRKKTLDEYEKRYAQLIEMNIILRAEIEEHEQKTLDDVKGLLRKYEKYRGGMTTLNTNFNKEYATALQELADSEARVSSKLEELQKEVDEVDTQLKIKQDELHILNNYKDKEYPVKAMKISNLQKEIQSLKISNEEDQDELEHITRTELAKYEKEKQTVQNEITKSVTEKAIDMMHPSLKDMALQNMVMKKEIELHQKEQEELLKSNIELEQSVRSMLRDPKSNVRQQMFPEFFPSQEKCTPDMDVVLDIPTQTWLPI